MGLSPCLKFVIGRALTILSWDDPVTAFFEKVEKLRRSLGRPSRSDFVYFQSCGEIERNRRFEVDELFTESLEVINSCGKNRLNERIKCAMSPFYRTTHMVQI